MAATTAPKKSQEPTARERTEHHAQALLALAENIKASVARLQACPDSWGLVGSLEHCRYGMGEVHRHLVSCELANGIEAPVAHMPSGVEAMDALFTRAYIRRLDQITKQWTAFESFADMLDAAGGYRPSLRADGAPKAAQQAFDEMAEAYDRVQAARGDERRAYRN